MNKITNKSWINWALLATVIALGFALMEWVFRDSSLSDRLGWANVISVPERVRQTPSKSPSNFRILGLGDSFTIYRDEQGRNYLRIMEKLAVQAGHAVEVINLGRPGTGLDFYEGVARKYVDTLRPDLITVGLFLGDDIPNKIYPPQNINGARSENLKDWVKRQSRLINYGFRLAKQYFPSLQSGHFQEVLDLAKNNHGITDAILSERLNRLDPEIIALAKSDAINPWDLVNGLVLPNRYYDLITRPSNSTGERQLDALFAMLKRLNNFAKQRKIPVVFLTIPIRLQVSLGNQQYFKRLGVKVGEALIGVTPLQIKIANMMEQNELLHLDLLPALSAARSDIFIPLDTHLNNSGQMIAGTQLYQYLKKRNMLGSKKF